MLSSAFSRQVSQREAEMSKRSAESAVVMAHDAVSLFQRSLMVLVGEAVGEEADDGFVAHVGISSVGGFEHLDAPIIVGAEAILQVVFRHDVAPGNECLMTHEHTMLETVGSEMLGRSEMPLAHNLALRVDELRLTVNHRDVVTRFFGNAAKRVIGCESVTGIKKHEIRAACARNRLVHSIV